MPYMEINGGRVAYELLGDEDAEVIVLTPGGRFDMTVPGLRPLAEGLVAEGFRVLLWDRPNSGLSDIQFSGRSESHLRADTLYDLVTRLDLAPCVIAGGSGGARDSMVTVIEHPDIATKLVLWNIVGGVYSTMSLAGVYVLPVFAALSFYGMDGVMNLPEWKALIETNPRNRERFLALDPGKFRDLMMQWLDAFVPKPGQTIPGVTDREVSTIQVPTMIIRGGAADINHPKRTSLEVNCLIDGSQLVEPPWPEDAWERACERQAQGTGSIFDTWYLAAPVIAGFVRGEKAATPA